MDHLPIPDHCQPRVPQVPYLGVAPKYDEKGFQGFPERHGLQTDRLLTGDFKLQEQYASEWLESFLQEWLYFGTLHEFSKECNAPLQLGDFIQNAGAGERTITTRPLLSYTTSTMQFRQTPVKEASSLLDALHSAPKCVALTRSRHVGILRLSVALSIDLLCHSLGLFTKCHLGKIDEIFPVTSYGWELQQTMRLQGWCWNRTNRCLLDSVDISFITSLLPSYDTRSHERCLPEACFEQPYMLSQLDAKHDATCDGACQIVTIDEPALVQVLEEGGNPGIMMQADGSGNITPQVVNVLDHAFVAISHVWSHGLGNPDSNALPGCQMKRLYNFGSKLPDSEMLNESEMSKFHSTLELPPQAKSLVIWIDTLCVPITPRYKSLAITKLRELYRKASKVLVLDKHLLQVGEHWLERRLQILCSEWSRRLWTLQEGRLASSLYVQFKDEAVDIEDFLLPISFESLMESENPLHMISFATQLSLKKFFHSHEEPGQHFLNLVDDLGHRSTTMAKDEPICIATLLNIRLEDFNGAPTMVDIYRSCQAVPDDIVFVNGPKLKDERYRWAPSTLLNSGIQLFRSSEQNGVLTSSGFQIVKNGIHLLDAFEYDNTPFNLYYIYSDDGTVMWSFYGPIGLPRILAVEQPSRRLNRPAIILQRPEGRVSRGILVSDVEHDKTENVLQCKFEMNVKLDRWTEATATSLRNRTLSKDWKGPFNLYGRFEEDTTWCVR